MRILRYLFVVSVVLGIMILAISSIANDQNVVAATLAQMNPPTPAPTPTPGPPPRITPIPIPTLVQPLDTEDQVLKRVLEFNARVAVSSQPLSLDTLRLEPGRISIKWYPDRSFDGNQYSPDEFETGPVWAVTIKGNVHLNLPGARAEKYDSVTYIIAQKTGNFLGWRTGLPIGGQPSATPQIPITQFPSGGTPAVLTAAYCTQNPSGLSIRVTQQPGKSSLPGAAGPIHSFYVEGKGFTPGEKVTIVIKGRVTAAGTIGSTDETVGKDSTFATTVAAAVNQSNMPFDIFVIHKRGVACINLVAVQ